MVPAFFNWVNLGLELAHHGQCGLLFLFALFLLINYQLSQTLKSLGNVEFDYLILTLSLQVWA